MEGLFIFLIVFAGLFLAALVITLVFQLLCLSIWIRLAVGAGLIWLIWATVVPEAEPLAYIATGIIALGILSPWLIVILAGSAIVGYITMRNHN